jgi:hypothetical protein
MIDGLDSSEPRSNRSKNKKESGAVTTTPRFLLFSDQSVHPRERRKG